MGEKKKKMVNLALQGGGTHGAFAWGILDRLLEDGRIEIEGLSATSAGSMNAVAYAWGAMNGGPDGARTGLNDLWREVNKAGEALQSRPAVATGELLAQSLAGGLGRLVLAVRRLTRVFSPYQFNPLDINPLRDILCNCIDFEKLVRCDCGRAFHQRHQRPHGPGPRVPQRGDPRRKSSWRRPACPFISGPSRSRGTLLGRRIHGKPLALSPSSTTRSPAT